jgi:hypothetical protein
MRNTPLAFALLLGITAVAQDPAAPFAQTITGADLRRHLSVIAADSLEGRDTGSPGEQKAARYLTGEFRRLGLKPVGTDGYRQDIGLVTRTWSSPPYLVVNGQKRNFLDDFYLAPGAFSLPDEEKLDVVFAGYGIDDEKYSDFTDLAVRNKLVFILPGEPRNPDGTFRVSGTDKPSVWSDARLGVRRKLETLLNRGARGVISLLTMTDAEAGPYFERLRGLSNRGSLSFRDDPNPARRLPNFQVKTSVLKALFNLTDARFDDLKAGKLRPGSLTGSVVAKAGSTATPLPASNLAGLLEGTDKRDEVIVISAHYDHIGVAANGQVFNGANDNGSGTALVLEEAEAFAEAARQGYRPRRSLLFLLVTGEEKGLLGSQYYAEHPLLPLSQTVADLNTDMVGRTDRQHDGKPGYLYVIGSDKLSSELHAINEEANRKVGLTLDYTYNDPDDPNRFYYRSDHYNFAKNGIPSIFYFNGTHADYHQTTDDLEKIDFAAAERAARLVFYTAWELANREKRIAVDSHKP